MIESSYIVLEDGSRQIAPSVDVYAGQPVTIDANGKIAPATSTCKVFGLAKLDRNAYNDLVVGRHSIFGSGLMSVLCMGICKIKASKYNVVEVTDSVTSTPFVKKIYDDTKTYAPGDLLYVDANGLISNVADTVPGGKKSAFGRVLKVGAEELEIEVNPSVVTASAELA